MSELNQTGIFNDHVNRSLLFNVQNKVFYSNRKDVINWRRIVEFANWRISEVADWRIIVKIFIRIQSTLPQGISFWDSTFEERGLSFWLNPFILLLIFYLNSDCFFSFLSFILDRYGTWQLVIKILDFNEAKIGS